MNTQQAKQLIQTLFTQSFDKEKYTLFLRNLFKNFEFRDGHYTGNYIPDAFKAHIKQYWRIGKYNDENHNKLDLLVVEVKNLNTLERARTTLRNFAVDRLKKFEKDASLVAFYAENDNGSDWRFSFIKIEHEEYENDAGKIKLKQELTPARRYSYLVGVHENSHTVCKQFLPLLEKESNLTISDIESAFSVEKVTDEFFEQYKKLFTNLTAHLKKQNHFQQKSENEIDLVTNRFAKKLLGQIVFLYFLQKKGWLGVPKEKHWGEGSKRFLREQFDQITQQEKNYYTDFLQYLFYDALAKERNIDKNIGYYPRFDSRIPFLNGGLFEPDYDWQKEIINLPNTLFHNKEKSKVGDLGTGILDVFDLYNFTIKEDEPLEKDVAVDPEMLGKVFENMLDVSERKSSGSFYTPREIVHYMCQESLIHSLNTQIEKNLTTPVPKEDLEILIRKGRITLENDQRVQGKGKQTSTYKFQLPQSIRDNAKMIDNVLGDIKVCDPAIGSGAFLVAMLNEIINARLVLASHSGNNQNSYQLKRHAISKNIYGVDVDASAIDIARLRLWLSLIVDEDNYDTIEALPNLDYKIMQGDSLVSEFMGTNFDDYEIYDKKKVEKNLFVNDDDDDALIKELKQEKEQFQNETGGDQKIKLRQKIEKLIVRIFESRLKKQKVKYDSNIQKLEKTISVLPNKEHREMAIAGRKKVLDKDSKMNSETAESYLKKFIDGQKTKPFFLWKLFFAEIFQGENGGFDIVIGNPPYIQIQKFSGQPIQEVWEKQKYETFAKTGDIYCLFYEKGHHLLHDKGILAFITSNKWMRAKYGEKLRRFFAEKTQPLTLIDFSSFQVFATATVDTNVLVFRKEKRSSGVDACLIDSSFTRSTPLDIFVAKKSIQLNDLSSESWVISSNTEYEIKKQIEKIGTPLKDWDVAINYGIKTGFNEAFIIDGQKKDELIAQDPKSVEILKPVLRGQDIKRYRIDFADLWIIATFPALNLNIDDYPAIRSYLQSFGKKLNQTGEVIGVDEQGNEIKSRKKTTNKWFEIQDTIAYYEEFEKEKLVWADISRSGNSFAYNQNKMFMLNTGYIMTGKSLHYLIAVLNSQTILYYLDLINQKLDKDGWRWIYQYVENLPIPKINEQKQTLFCTMSEYIPILIAKNNHLQSTYFEQLIDGLVYELYFPEEIRAADKQILPYLGTLKPITNEMSSEEKLKIIQVEFERLYDPKHPVRNHLETLDSVEVVKTIREALKK